MSTKRLSLTRNGQIRYELKTPWRNGTTHVIFEPLDFMYRMYGMPRAQEAQELRYELKTPWRNGTTHVIFEPLDFISRLVALVPSPRVNLTRFHIP